MLGEQFGELKGKITGQRVLDAEGPAIETNVSATGNLAGSQVRVTLTYMGKSVSNGVLHGLGNGVVMSTEGDVASYTGEGIGKMILQEPSIGVGHYSTSQHQMVNSHLSITLL